MGLTDLKGASCCPFSAVPFTLVGAALFWVVSYNSLLSPDGTLLTSLCFLTSSMVLLDSTLDHPMLPLLQGAQDTLLHGSPQQILGTQTNAKAAACPWLHHWKWASACPLHFQGRSQTPGIPFLGVRNKYLKLPECSQCSLQLRLFPTPIYLLLWLPLLHPILKLFLKVISLFLKQLVCCFFLREHILFFLQSRLSISDIRHWSLGLNERWSWSW